MRKRLFSFLSTLLLITILFLGCNSPTTKSTPVINNSFKVHYIDVDQGDAILIQVNNKNLLIDSSTSSAKDKFLNYLDKLKIKKLDYIIATHPHEDHIGNMYKVIEKYDIGELYAPKVTSSTATFKKMMNSLNSKNKKVNVIKKGTNTINLGDNVKFEIFSPIKTNYGDNLNNYSPIIKITYKSTSFLFTGDAEVNVENEVLDSNVDLKSDVLKVGHHGSSSSTSDDFLNAVNPKFAIISCGKDNKYGHPHKETLSKLNANNITVYRTDNNGTIILKSDGNDIIKD